MTFGKRQPTPSPDFSHIKEQIWVKGLREGLGKAVYSWHNCVVETWCMPCGDGLSDERV